ncbi:MAG TPA: LuxR C-terminal-related transcriptional regulator [Dehalococcoidia bacterium]|nr:LuxR C-terminal-related transcriptional regulator [Dehalococcoidia bacterium]
MSSRGRPKTPDILTDREWQVLDLIRRGLSNREIAEALGISLAGAKFHVSEIISKLAVESREEAAAWRPAGRRFFALLPALGQPLSVSITWKLVFAIVVVPVAVAGIAFAGERALDGSSSGGASASSTPDPYCPVPNCIRIQPQRLTTVQEAATLASFNPSVPDYVPAGFHRYAVTFYRFADPPIDKSVHNDWIDIFYKDASGHILHVSQGFPAFPPVYADLDLYKAAAPDKHGVLSIAGRTGYWLSAPNWFVLATSGNDLPVGVDRFSEGTLVGWEVGRFGTGWELSPDRSSLYSGSPFTVSIGSDSLPLEELTKVAESMRFDP